MALPTFSQLVTQMINFIHGKKPTLNTNVGTLANDVVISTVANQLSAQDGTSQSVYSSINYTQELQSFAVDAAILVPSDLNNIAVNYGMQRLSGTAASGSITFRIRNFQTSSASVTVVAGTTVSTLATSQSPAVSFSTTATVTFDPNQAPSYFNASSGFYEQTAPIICQTIGIVGNVGSLTITSLVSSTPGIDAVTNIPSTTGGTDTESNTAFAARIQIKLEGNNVGTINGIISLVNTNPSVLQAIVVGPNDSEMQRDQFGGSVDVYIKGQILTTINNPPETHFYTTTGSKIFILNHQPVSLPTSSISITGVVGLNPTYLFAQGTDYTVHINPNSLFAGSTEAASYIEWTSSGGTYPDPNSNFFVTYTYDSLIETLQALFTDNNNHIVASDVLVREAQEAFIGVVETILVLPGFIPANVQTSVVAALSDYINSLGLGAVIDLSDIVFISEAVLGVDAVLLDTISVSSTIGATTTTIPPPQRLSPGKLAFTVPAPGGIVISIG